MEFLRTCLSMQHVWPTSLRGNDLARADGMVESDWMPEEVLWPRVSNRPSALRLAIHGRVDGLRNRRSSRESRPDNIPALDSPSLVGGRRGAGLALVPQRTLVSPRTVEPRCMCPVSLPSSPAGSGARTWFLLVLSCPVWA